MIIGIGIDLVKNDRIKAAATRWSSRFLNRVFTESERRYAFARKLPYTHLAGRFAVKEAVLKAMGVGWGKGVRWQEIALIPKTDGTTPGKPHVRVTGETKKLMDEQGVRDIQVSLSHDTDYAIAQVLLLGGGGPGGEEAA